MKFTLSWLKTHLDTDASVDEIADTLTDLGLEVEGIENPAAKLSDFVIGKVTAAQKHPDADKLRVCTVEAGEGPTQIICGAPNAREGITVVVAKPGTYIPGLDITISVGKIRGIESFGMMASEKELELSDEHNGIIELPAGEVGQSFADYLAEHDPAQVDPVIEIAITPNRPDALGVRGVARDLAARGLGTMIDNTIEPVPATFANPVSVSIDADTLDQAPVFFGRVIKGVKNGPSPAWLQNKLKAIGLRPISFLVDVTNWFTYDLNRPLHVFDADKITGNTLRLHRAAGDETLVGLDEKEYTLPEGATVISDAEGPESIAGVMGGLRTGVSDDTVNVFVEAAYFDTVRTAYTGRALKLNTDARYRFERGIDPAFTPDGMEHAVRMIVDIAGGEASQVVQAGEIPDTSRAYKLDTARCSSLVGMDIPADTQHETLTKLGFVMDGDMAQVPAWRPDVQGEADLVEEVARMASLSNLEPKPLPRPAGVPAPILTPMQKRLATARRTTASLGYNECVTYSFIDKTAAEMFGGGTDATMLANPISSEMSHMRPALLPGLLQAAARNQARGISNLALFEAGDAFHGGEPGEQHTAVTGILVGKTASKDVHGASRDVDIYDAKADAEAILAAMGAPAKVQILRGAGDAWHPGRHGQICLGPKKVLGVFGEIHPKILTALNVKGPVVGFTLYPAEIPMPKKQTANRGAATIPDLQAVERDFAFVMDTKVDALTAVNAAAGADKALIDSVRIFDEFIGGSLGEDQKSLAMTVRLQPIDKTLKEADIEAVSAKIIEKVTKATGGTLRG